MCVKFLLKRDGLYCGGHGGGYCNVVDGVVDQVAMEVTIMEVANFNRWRGVGKLKQFFSLFFTLGKNFSV